MRLGLVSSVSVVGAALLVAGCSSSSPHRGAALTASPTVSASVSPSESVVPLPSPVINDSEGADEMTGAALVTYSTDSSPFTVRTGADQPAQVGVDPSGHVSVDVTMNDAAGDLFALSGPAAVGRAVSGDHVSLLSPKTGLFVDTDQGNRCSVSYTRAGESGVVGKATCQAQTGAQSFTVTASFHLT